MLKRVEKLSSLCFEAGVMQVEQALYRISPVQTAFARGEERVGVPDGMNDNVGGFEGILDPLQSGIELCDKIEVHMAPWTVN